MSRQKIESAPHPRPCEVCAKPNRPGRATRIIINGVRTCYVCMGTVKEQKKAS